VSRNVHWYNRLGIQVVLHLVLFLRTVMISQSLEGVAEKFVFCRQVSLWFFFQKENLQSEKAKSELENLLIHLPILIRFKGTVVPDQCKVASVFAALIFQPLCIYKGFFVGQVHVVFPEKDSLHDYQELKRNRKTLLSARPIL